MERYILTPEIYYIFNSFVLFFVSKKYLKIKNNMELIFSFQF